MARETIIGRVGTDPELTKSPSGKDMAKFRLAESVYNRDTKEEETKWHTVTAWERQALIANEEVHKGMRIYVTGDTSIFEGTSGNVNQINAREIGAADRFTASEGSEW
jgi:single stranded DNA-binding protein